MSAGGTRELRALVVDDEEHLARLVADYLARDGFTTQVALDGEHALEAARAARPDVVILDLTLPGIDGVEVCRQLRTFTDAYVIMLTARAEEVDKLIGLAVGADDYLTKPFSTGELMARMRVATRRALHVADEPSLQVDQLLVDLSHHRVTLAGVEISLTPTEYDLLRLLIQNRGKVLTHRQILRQVWGPTYEAETHLLRVNISNMRRKIEPDLARPSYILTEPGVGYRLRAEVAE